MALFLLKTGTCDTKNCWEFFVDNRIFLEKLITVSSRLNALIVLWRLNNNYWTLPSRVGLKLLTWQLESVAGLLSTRVTWAVYCPLHWQFRAFEMGILVMWMMENLRFLSGHLFLAELSPCRKWHGIYRHGERSQSREVCQPSLLFSLLSSGKWHGRSKKGLRQCLGGLKCSQNTKKNKKTLKVSFKAIFNVHFANLVSKDYFSIQRLIIFLLYE